MNDIGAWLARLGLAQFAELFREHLIDHEVLPVLTEDDLEKLGLPLGARKKILNAIAALDGADETPERPVPAPPAPTPSAPASQAERRQLTVMFVDLAGSTELSTKLDPEDMREVIRAYQNSVAGEIARLEGHVAKFMGDGVLAYFGWPQAHEDDAERAVRTGCDLVRTVTGLTTPDGQRLGARVGIATGLVVVGDLVGDAEARERAVVGETPNLAARLQALAAPGEVVIAESTRRLVGAGFELRDLGAQELKGIAAPVGAYAVLGARSPKSRFEAMSGRAILPMVGRDQELALLLERWALAKAGEGQGVLLTGEAGIGKSRVTQGILDALTEEPHVRVRIQCSPYHADSALWPVTQQLLGAAGITAADTVDERLDKLEALLARAGDAIGEDAPLIADLLGLEGEARYRAPKLTPQVQRARTLDALVRQLLGLAQTAPVLFVCEDAHWVDPTTLELVGQSLDRIADARVLMLLTSRPDQQPALAAHPHVTRLTLNRLGRAGVQAIIRRLAGDAFSGEVVEAIVARTDGVPLFVEELTKAVLETGETAIPASLHDSLMARLDRIPEVKEVAQVAACIGREFPHGLLAAVAGRADADLAAALDRLAAAELVFRRGTPPEASYTFKHALVRDVAYESLLRSRRQKIHAGLFEELQRRNDAPPEIRAHHAEAAGLLESAIVDWRCAADLAAGASAYREAASHYEHALEVIALLPESPGLTGQAIDIRLDLRNCLVPIGEVERALRHCREAGARAQDANDDPRRTRAAAYISVLLWHLGIPTEALDLGREAVQRVSRLGDPNLEVAAGFFLGQVRHGLGQYREARQLYERVIAALQGERQLDRCDLPFLPACHARSWLALVLAEQGDFELGIRTGRQAVRISEEADQPFSQQQAYWGLGTLFLLKADLESAAPLLERAMAVTRAWDLHVWLPAVSASVGMLRALSGEVDEGIAVLEKALDPIDERRHSAAWQVPVTIAHGRACLIAGRPDAALASAERALALAREREQAGDEAWTRHLIGEIRLRDDGRHTEQAERSFRQALSLAGRLGMRPLEAHCTLGLARVDAARGDVRKAEEGMQGAAKAFTQLGMNGPAREASDLLDSLA